MREFRLPDPGEGLVEAEIIQWHVAEGDEVTVNQIVVDVETAKSIVELPIPWTGTVAQILVPVGETVAVGTPIISIDDGSRETAPRAGGDGRTPVLVGYGAKESSTARRPRRAATDESAPDATSAPTEPVAPVEEPAHRPLAKPPVRKLARDLGVDLAAVEPTGPNGTITRDDVQAAASPSESSGSTVTRLADRRVPIKGVRKATAQAMVQSAFTAPHVSAWVEIDVTASMDLLDRLRARREFRDVKLSPLALIARAVCLTLPRYPEVNSSWDDAAGEIVYHSNIDLGIAAATERGLLVPKVRQAQDLPLLELVAAVSDVVNLARSGKAQPAQLANGTFTITNIGVFNVDAGTPILSPGEAAILAVGQITRKPWVVGTGADERIEPRWVTTLALSFDHRLIDGEQGSKFLAEVAELLRDPALVMAR